MAGEQPPTEPDDTPVRVRRINTVGHALDLLRAANRVFAKYRLRARKGFRYDELDRPPGVADDALGENSQLSHTPLPFLWSQRLFVLKPGAEVDGFTSDDVLDEILGRTEIPR